MLEVQASGTDGFCITARRNCSIAPLPFCLCLLAAALFSLVLAIVWALLGAWLILPFAGAEVAALAAALVWSARHVGDYERICLREGKLTVEVRESSHVSYYEFNPLWARIVSAGSGRRAGVSVRSHGSELEIGRHLSDDGRRLLTTELRRRLYAAYD